MTRQFMPISPRPPSGMSRTMLSGLVLRASVWQLFAEGARRCYGKGVAIRSVSPEEAAALLADGYVYVDVRSEPEFEAGHVPGALNVPLLHQGPGGMTANPEFLPVMQQAFGKSEKMVIGCKAGGRSKRAAEQLAQAGFSELVDMPAGWDGSRDA